MSFPENFTFHGLVVWSGDSAGINSKMGIINDSSGVAHAHIPCKQAKEEKSSGSVSAFAVSNILVYFFFTNSFDV